MLNVLNANKHLLTLCKEYNYKYQDYIFKRFSKKYHFQDEKTEHNYIQLWPPFTGSKHVVKKSSFTTVYALLEEISFLLTMSSS
jgi:hypothetical protein